jgi:hypothetical protein
MTEKEHDGTREMLRRSASGTPPPALEDRIMHRVLMMADKRAKRRLILSALLRFFALALLLVALAQTFLPAGSGKNFVAAVERLPEYPGQKISWLRDNVYFLFPLIALFFFTRINRLRRA